MLTPAAGDPTEPDSVSLAQFVDTTHAGAVAVTSAVCSLAVLSDFELAASASKPDSRGQCFHGAPPIGFPKLNTRSAD